MEPKIAKNGISLIWPIHKLKNWESNPRTINKKDFERLKAQIKKLGIYKPLIVTDDGTVLGGNMRLKALEELGDQEVWVSVVEAPTEADKLEYALSDNDQVGTYAELELAELVQLHQPDMELYKVHLDKPKQLDELPSLVDPTTAPTPGDECRHCPEHCPQEGEE